MSANFSSFLLQKYSLVFLLLGSALAINPFLTTDVFEFPKLLVLLISVATLTLVQLVDSRGAAFFSWRKWPRRLRGTAPELRSRRLRDTAPELRSREFWWLGLFGLGSVVSFIFSLDHGISLLGRGFRYQGFITDIYFIFLTFNTWYFFRRYPEEHTRTVFSWLLGGLLAVSALALLPYIFPMVFPLYFFTPSFFADRVFGTFGNPNYLAAFLISLLPFLFAANLRRVVFFPCVALVILTLFLTGTRSAWGASLDVFFIVGFFYAIKQQRTKVLAFVALAVTLLLIGLFFRPDLSSFSPAFSRISLDSEGSTSLQTRRILLGAGLKLFLARPITGYGQENIRDYIEPFLPEYLQKNDVFYVDRTHSELMDILVTRGFAAAIGYVVFFLAIMMAHVWRWWKSGKGPLDPALIGLMTLFTFHAVNFSTISSNVLLFFFAGYLLSRLSTPGYNPAV